MDAPPASAAPVGRVSRGMGTAKPNRKPRNPGVDRAVYALSRLFVLLFLHLPGPAARWVARRVGDLAWALSPRYRRQMLRHMDIAFGGTVPLAQKRIWCRRNFQHMALFVAEFSRMERLTPGNVGALCDLRDLEKLREVQARGRGVIGLVAHVGNWELCGYAAALAGLRLNSVARPLDNPLLNEFLDATRKRAGIEVLHKWQVLWRLKKLLNRGEFVTLTVDQNAGDAGTFVPLFGVLSSTMASPAWLQQETGAPIVVCTLNRQADGVHHVLHLWDVIEPAPSGDEAADRVAVLTRISAAFEKAVRAYPEQWLWVHKRWKSRPPGEAPGPDGLPPRVSPLQALGTTCAIQSWRTKGEV